VHELSLCQNLIDQLADLVSTHDARAVARVRLEIGALSGVEALLLESAFAIAKMDTVAAQAELITAVVAPRVLCEDCGRESDTSPSNLCCPACGSALTELVRGNELMLASVELMVDEGSPPSPP